MLGSVVRIVGVGWELELTVGTLADGESLVKKLMDLKLIESMTPLALLDLDQHVTGFIVPAYITACTIYKLPQVDPLQREWMQLQVAQLRKQQS